MVDPRVELLDSTVADTEDAEHNDWLDRTKHSINNIVIQIRRWMNEHVFITDPSNPENPHPQYPLWRNVWSIGYYPWNSMVIDDGWLMICNNPDGTTERAAPQPIGNQESDMPDVPAFVENSFLGVAWTGHEYVLTKGGWLQAIAVWVTEITEDTNYRIIIVDNSDPINPKITTIEEPVLTPNAWTYITVGAVPFAIGSNLAVILDALNSGSDTIVTGGWGRTTDDNDTEPPTGSWNRRVQDDILRINFTDLDGVGRQGELESIIPGSDIEIVSVTNALQSVSYHVDVTTTGTNAVIYNVVRNFEGPSGSPPVGDDCIITATVPTPLETKYVEIVGNWPANDPSFSTMRGLKRLGGVDQPADSSAFGVRAVFQEANVSQDWDMMAYTDLSSGQAVVSQDDIDQIIDILGGA